MTRIDIKEGIKNNKIVVFVIPNKEYAARLEEIITALSKVYKSMCYVSLNKPYNVLINKLKKSKIDTEKFFFIDCITESVEGNAVKDHVFYVYSPKALTELSITIKKVLDKAKIEITIFDSLSTLLIYEEIVNVIRFTQSLMTTLRTRGSGGIFTCLKEGISEDLIKDLNMFADKVITLDQN